MLRALKVRDFALLWSGGAVSSLGDGIFTVALAIVALDVDHHPSGIAFVFAARAIPSVLLALVGGVVVDRVPRRFVMISSDAVRGAAVGLTGLLIARGELRLWELIIMAATFGAADSFFSPASMTIVPELLSADLLVAGNALGQFSSQLTQGLLGPALGGLVVAAIGTAWSFGFDAASFFVSALCVLLLRSRRRPAPSEQSPMEDARAGLRYVRRHRWLWYSILGAAIANFVGITPLAVLLPLFVRQTLHGSAFALGLVFAAGGASGIVASIIVARFGSPKRFVSVLWCAYAAGGIAIAALAFSPNALVAGLLVAGWADSLRRRLVDGDAPAARPPGGAWSRLVARLPLCVLPWPARLSRWGPRRFGPRRAPGHLRERVRRGTHLPLHTVPSGRARPRARGGPRHFISPGQDDRT